jgi:glycosyltransferase involved in cell wall biosynthesis
MSAMAAGRARVPVLTFLTNFLIGGTERQVVNLVQNHDRDRFDVHLACFHRRGPLLDEIDTERLRLTDYPIRSLPSPRTLWQQGRLARYVHRCGIRLVHSFGFYANVFAVSAARLGGAAVVVASIRDTGDHLGPLQRALQKLVCRGADHVLVNAIAVKQVLVRQGYNPSRISVIPNGIDTSRFRGRSATTGLRRELGVPERARLVVAVCRLNKLKGIEYFLDAAALLLRRFPDVRYMIVGDSISQAYRDELQARATALGLGECARFTGFRSDVPALLSEASVSVLPSLSEGLSNVVLETMAAGVPVVATSVGGTPEMVEEGVTGLLVAPRDAVALAEAIGSLLADPERAGAVGTAGREWVAQRFSLEAMVRGTEALYERLLRQARVRSVLPLDRLTGEERP